MTTASDLGYTDDDDLDPNPQATEKAAREAAFAQRKAAREAKDAELAELREFKAGKLREDALTAAKDDLKATGPLSAFLRSYTGEPNADAIKAAVAADPDFKDLVTFPVDPRDAAAAEQHHNAVAQASGTPGALPPKQDVAPGQARIEKGYANRAARKT